MTGPRFEQTDFDLQVGSLSVEFVGVGQGGGWVLVRGEGGKVPSGGGGGPSLCGRTGGTRFVC